MKKCLPVLMAVFAVGLTSPEATIAHRVPSQQLTYKVRPPLHDAQHAAWHRAWYDCVNVTFPYDPQSQRCLTAGVDTGPFDRWHTRRKWHIAGWETNNSFVAYRVWILVRYARNGLVKTNVESYCPYNTNGYCR